tara:strand:+ start:2690 stop:2998 length:309 start_codon:yes stop_codon:yes gene_type:complete
MKKYCQDCGSPYNYTLNNAPKFCPECGTSFTGTPKSSTQASMHTSVETDGSGENVSDEDDISNDVQTWNGTTISSLDVDITPPHDTSFKLGQLFPSPPEEKK